MMPGQNDLLPQILKEIEDLKENLRRLEQRNKLYEILNISVPAVITADQHNYDPGNADLLALQSNASHTITGIAGGRQGRVLQLVNGGTQNIVLAHASGLSLAANQILIPGNADLTMSPLLGSGAARSVMLYHSGGVWVLLYRAVP